MVYAVTIDAVASETGMEAQTPLSPKNLGRTANAGIRNSSCLDRERKILILTFPMHWKKLVITIWKPMMGNIIVTILSPLMDRLISVWFTVKSLTQ